jgi:prepilin-type N-terminal cleavage/methylation domain-containing protein
MLLNHIKTSRQKGFSLLETLVALALGGIALISAIQIYIQSQQAHQHLSAQNELEQNGRVALHILRQHLTMAGYVDWIKKDEDGTLSIHNLSFTAKQNNQDDKRVLPTQVLFERFPIESSSDAHEDQQKIQVVYQSQDRDCLGGDVKDQEYVHLIFLITQPTDRTDPVNQLYCGVKKGKNVQKQPIARGVEELRFRYLLSDGSWEKTIKGWGKRVADIEAVMVCIALVANDTQGVDKAVLQDKRPSCKYDDVHKNFQMVTRESGDHRRWLRYHTIVALKNNSHAYSLSQ